jgi:tetratricopeptide (TPR) repeat protein
MIVKSRVISYNPNELSPMKYLAAPLCALLLLTACTQSPQKLIATANKYHARHKYKEASILYQKAILRDKTSAEAYYLEGLNLIDDHDPVNAVKYLRRAVDLNPNNVDAETKLAEIYLSAYASNPSHFKAILPEIQELTNKILAHDPNSFDGMRLEGLLALANKNLPEALKDFARANEIKPYSPEVVGWYAAALVQDQKTDQAIALVKDTLAHNPKWSAGYDFLFLQYSHANDKQQAEAVLREHIAKDPHNALAIAALANYLLSQNRFEEAQATMQTVLNDKAAFPAGHALMGDFYVRAKKYDLALQQYQAGASENPKDALPYQERMVDAYLLMGQRQQAMDLAKTLADRNPDNVPVNETYARLLLNSGNSGDVKTAVNKLKVLAEKNPNNPDIHLDLAHGYFEINQTDQALNEAQETITEEMKQRVPHQQVLIPARLIAGRIYEDRGDHSKALEMTDSVLRVEPLNPDAQLIRDRAWFATGQVDQAQADLESLLQRYPQMNDARVVLGDIYLSKNDFNKASIEYLDAWKANPPDIRGFLGLQTVKVKEGKAGEAVQAMQQLVDKNPKVPAFRYQLANFQVQAGLQALHSNAAQGKAYLEQAADNYKEILKSTTNSADVWLHLGAVQRALGQQDAALASFEQASAADPHNAQALLSEGMLLGDLGKQKEAEAAYNKVLGIDPENPVALNNLAFINAEKGSNLDQAESFAERAKQEAPNSPDISDTLGYVYYRKNLNSAALSIFKQLVEQQPNNPTYRLHLAMALLKQGNKQEARSEAEKALKNATEAQQQNQIRSFVNQIG